MALQSLKAHDNPEPGLEQYPTPPAIAADVLYTAFGMGDIGGKRVVDLGCGTGIFAIGASMLGAQEVTGVDIDPKIMKAARANAEAVGCDITFIETDVTGIEGRFDTCIQNPPFGAQRKHADLPFLHKSLEIAGVVYTLHNSLTSDFIEREVKGLRREICFRKRYSFELKHSFKFHRKEREFVDVTMFRIE